MTKQSVKAPGPLVFVMLNLDACTISDLYIYNIFVYKNAEDYRSCLKSVTFITFNFRHVGALCNI